MSDFEVASAHLPRFVGPPSREPLVGIRDVIVCPTFDYDPEICLEELRTHPPVAFAGPPGEAAGAISIGSEVRIDRLPNDEAELVMNACTPRGHHFVPIRQFGQRYSFVRELDPESLATQSARFTWDPDGVLWDCLSLSRLIRDNAYSTQYAARILDYGDGQQQIIYASNPPAQQVYRLRTDRDWLDPNEARTLSQLAATFWSVRQDLPERVQRAMWRTELASWIAWADVTTPIIVSGLEALLKTRRHHATSQFTTRVPALATYLGIGDVSSELCEQVYDGRSDWTHGAHVRLFAAGASAGDRTESRQSDDDRGFLRVVALFQDVLRAAVRRSIEDPETRRIFESDATVEAHWSRP